MRINGQVFQAKEEIGLGQITAAMLTEHMEDGSPMKNKSNRLRTMSLELSVRQQIWDLGSVNRAL